VLFPALNPIPFSLCFTFSTITAGSSPALIAICFAGSSKAFRMIFPPIFSLF